MPAWPPSLFPPPSTIRNGRTKRTTSKARSEPSQTLFPLSKSPPQYTFLGLPVDLPLGIPAGPLVNGRYVRAALDHGFSIPVYKTVRTHAYASHAWPNVLPVDHRGDITPGTGRLRAGRSYAEPLSITNSFGVPSFSPDVWQPDMAAAAAYARPGQVVVGSFQGTKSEGGNVEAYIADFALGARLVRQTGVPVVEVNLSCPNEGTAALLCFDIPRTQRIVEAIKTELGSTPLIIKIAYFEDHAALTAFVRAVGPMVEAISAINTISAEVVDSNGEQALPGEGRLRSGVCGAGIRWAGLEMTARLAALRDELGLGYEIVGVGGVNTPADYTAYREARADAVMSATGAMWNPLLATQIAAKANDLAIVEEHAHAG